MASFLNRKTGLILLASSVMLFSCKEKIAENSTENFKKANREYLRKHALCTCLELIDSSIANTDYSKGIYFEKSSYDPDVFPLVDSAVKKLKPNFKSFADHKLGVAECIELYEGDSLKNAIIKLDLYLADPEK